MTSIVRVAGILAAFLLVAPVASAGVVESGESQPYARALDALVRDRPEDAFALVADGAGAGDAASMFISGFLQDIGAGVIVSHEKALPLLERSAAVGYEPALRYLAWRHTTGFGSDAPDPGKAAELRAMLPTEVTIDRGISRWLTVEDGMCAPRLSMALYWMMDRAGDDDPIAEANLATAFLNGGWTTPDMGQHIYWLQRAAEHKEPESMVRLALYVGLGLTGAADPARELQLIRSAAEAGHAEAQYILAERLRLGRGVEEDVAAAAGWYRKAAAQEHVESMVEIGDLLREGGPGLERDLEAAYGFSRRAADLGNPEAMTDAANMLRKGEGVPADIAEATRLFERAAGTGYAYAADMLGWMAMNGEGGAAPDFERARKWYEESAAGGNEHAMRELGKIHGSGIGVAKDDAKSFEWYESAAREGDAWSQNRVGWMLRQGIGIERDDEEAVTWFHLAAKNGLAIAHGNLAYHFLLGLGTDKDPIRAFEHVCICLLEGSDEWAKSTLMQVVQNAGASERSAIARHLEEQVAKPGFIEASGSLPEVALELLGSGPTGVRNTAAASKLLARMVGTRREASLTMIAWHYYTGVGVPLDVAKARQYANEAVAAGVDGAVFVKANIESIAGETQEEREKSRSILHELADSGDKRAAALLAQRMQSGIGEAIDPEGAKRLFRIAYPMLDDDAETVIAQIIERSGTRSVTPPSDEEFEKLKAAVPFAKDRPPKPVYTAAPIYPYDLNRSRVEGHATVRMVVSVDGIPREVEAVDSSHPLFAAAAVEAVRMWRFAPGIKEGSPVASNVQQTLRFMQQVPEEEETTILENPNP
ncbi:MAG TPA: TonB family protein [Opitutaceae bacterium]|nr:TonB family protein [Opitutaceae bacterium]